MSDLEVKVEQSLETLHKALNNLEPAIVHVQTVMKASDAVKAVITENINFLNNQKHVNETHRNNLLTSLNEGVDDISVKTSEVLTEIEKTGASIVSENVSFLNDQKRVNEDVNNELVNLFNAKVNEISTKSNEVLDGVRNSTEDIVVLDRSVNSYLENIKQVDFPTRLTSIENDISSVSTAFNNIQGTVINIQNEIVRLERETKADALVITNQIKSDTIEISQKIEFINKENKTLKILIIVTAIISLAGLITNFIN